MGMECILKYSQQQEALTVDMILQNNSVRMREIQQWVVKDNLDFGGTIRFSLFYHSLYPPALQDVLLLRGGVAKSFIVLVLNLLLTL